MENEFSKKMSTLSDEELDKILLQKGDWQAGAIEAAENEIKYRRSIWDRISLYSDQEIMSIIETENENLLDFSIAEKIAFQRKLIALQKEKSDNPDVAVSTIKRRHGFVTTWLILVIVLNALNAFNSFLAGTGDGSAQDLIQYRDASHSTYFLIAILSLANVIFAVLLLYWKKVGYFGCIFSGIIALMFNIYHGQNFGRALIGFAGILVLYGILQIKKDNVTAWNNLK
jgi:hypothetical protein